MAPKTKGKGQEPDLDESAFSACSVERVWSEIKGVTELRPLQVIVSACA